MALPRRSSNFLKRSNRLVFRRPLQFRSGDKGRATDYGVQATHKFGKGL